MNKLTFWFMIFLGCMFAFFKYGVGSNLELDSIYKIILNLGIWTVCFSILYYGTPNGFIRGFKKRDTDNRGNNN